MRYLKTLTMVALIGLSVFVSTANARTRYVDSDSLKNYIGTSTNNYGTNVYGKYSFDEHNAIRGSVGTVSTDYYNYNTGTIGYTYKDGTQIFTVDYTAQGNDTEYLRIAYSESYSVTDNFAINTVGWVNNMSTEYGNVFSYTGGVYGLYNFSDKMYGTVFGTYGKATTYRGMMPYTDDNTMRYGFSLGYDITDEISVSYTGNQASIYGNEGYGSLITADWDTDKYRATLWLYSTTQDYVDNIAGISLQYKY